jgi:hypothetical protein
MEIQALRATRIGRRSLRAADAVAMPGFSRDSFKNIARPY